ncbi:molybdenum cofactor guanylyltransferase [Aquimarina addita]|uniref:Probable molybdenum cofactor guanylyltransferase n=1 Tax=Aquimarina addita TaxID=870485 RepID=A0ABP6UMF2_9FLAO
MSSIKRSDITGIILAGGKSSRMGQEKGLVKHNGIPFIEHIIRAMETVTDQILIITSQKAYQKYGYKCIPDIFTECGPIGGIYSGLSKTSTTHNLILSCDIPFITSFVLENLIHKHRIKYDITYYDNNPLIGLYNQSVTHKFLQSIEQKQLRLMQLLFNLKVQVLEVTEQITPLVRNINTPEQYNKANIWI